MPRPPRLRRDHYYEDDEEAYYIERERRRRRPRHEYYYEDEDDDESIFSTKGTAWDVSRRQRRYAIGSMITTVWGWVYSKVFLFIVVVWLLWAVEYGKPEDGILEFLMFLGNAILMVILTIVYMIAELFS